MKKSALKAVIFFIFSCYLLLATCYLAFAQTESITLTTYYPSPVGEYQNLRLNPSGDPGCDATKEGLMYYDNGLNAIRVCGGAGPAWQDVGGGGPWDWDNPNNRVTLVDDANDNVGIGTANPSAGRLQVREDSGTITYPLVLQNDDGNWLNRVGVGIQFHRDRPWAAIAGQQEVSNNGNWGSLLLQTRTSDAAGLETKMAILANGNVWSVGDMVPGNNGALRAIVPLAMFDGTAYVDSNTDWTTITRTTYTWIDNLFAGTPVLSGATRKYYLIIRKADNKNGGNGSAWRFRGGWSGIIAQGFTVWSDWGSLEEGTTTWVEIPPDAMTGSGCSGNQCYWAIDARMLNAGFQMRVFSVSMAAVDVYNGTNIAYNGGGGGNIKLKNSWLNGAIYQENGNIGIGTNAPADKLHVITGAAGIRIEDDTNSGRYGVIKRSSGAGGNLHIDSYIPAVAGEEGHIYMNHYSNRNIYMVTGGGKVGIGTTNPSRTLYVQGDIGMSGGAGVKGVHADVAEDIPADKGVEAADVVTIDPENNERVIKSSRAYDTTVAGIISTHPAFLIDMKDSDTPLALAGRVKCKAITENGPIKRGDLLVTSSKPGYAMKASPEKLGFGMVIGKALEPLDKGEGKITVLVNVN